MSDPSAIKHARERLRTAPRLCLVCGNRRASIDDPDCDCLRNANARSPNGVRGWGPIVADLRGEAEHIPGLQEAAALEKIAFLYEDNMIYDHHERTKWRTDRAEAARALARALGLTQAEIDRAASYAASERWDGGWTYTVEGAVKAARARRQDNPWCQCGEKSKPGYYWQFGEHQNCLRKEHIHCETCRGLCQVG